jgi:hypothetical protein
MRRALPLSLLLSLPGAVGSAAEVPERSATGMTLAVPEGQVGDGQAYYVLEGDTQLTIRSRAELQGVTLTSGRAVGYLVGPFVEDNEEDDLAGAAVTAGALRIPAHSLRSGVAATDDMVQSAPLLDVANHPEITVLLEGLTALAPQADGDGAAGDALRANGTAAVSVGFKGEARALEVPLEITFRLSSNDTMTRMMGDIATVRSTFDLELADWGIELPPSLSTLFAPKVQVDVSLTLTTANPDEFVFLIPEDQFQTESRIRSLLRDQHRTNEGYALARTHLETHRDDASVLKRVVSDLLDLDDVERRDFALLSEAAHRADELAGGDDPAVTALLARLQFELGHVDRAVELQRGVADQLGEPGAAQLAHYEAALP